jgi:hypothetical protein
MFCMTCRHPGAHATVLAPNAAQSDRCSGCSYCERETSEDRERDDSGDP